MKEMVDTFDPYDITYIVHDDLESQEVKVSTIKNFHFFF